MNKKETKKEIIEKQKKCKHPPSQIQELQGGQIDRCRKCGKEWS